ncbi:unnamed protein product, partial [Amoebophrya sp. A25]|eukprot:GSA25T00025691001.1
MSSSSSSSKRPSRTLLYAQQQREQFMNEWAAGNQDLPESEQLDSEQQRPASSPEKKSPPAKRHKNPFCNMCGVRHRETTTCPWIKKQQQSQSDESAAL